MINLFGKVNQTNPDEIEFVPGENPLRSRNADARTLHQKFKSVSHISTNLSKSKSPVREEFVTMPKTRIKKSVQNNEEAI